MLAVIPHCLQTVFLNSADNVRIKVTLHFFFILSKMGAWFFDDCSCLLLGDIFGGRSGEWGLFVCLFDCFGKKLVMYL